MMQHMRGIANKHKNDDEGSLGSDAKQPDKPPVAPSSQAHVVPQDDDDDDVVAQAKAEIQKLVALRRQPAQSCS
eukprot:7793318-Prorocentrum_lima.AAC.1